MSEQVSMEQAYRELQQALFDATDRIRELEAERDAAMDAGMDLTKRLTDACLELEQAKAENARLREVLEFYADEKNWSGRVWSAMAADLGEKARRALEGEP